MKSNSLLPRVGIEVAGWGLVVIGFAAIFLPGPGLLSLFAGLAILSQQYEWAERRVRPVEIMALKSAAQSVQTWPRILASTAGALSLAAIGVFWASAPMCPTGGRSPTTGGSSVAGAPARP